MEDQILRRLQQELVRLIITNEPTILPEEQYSTCLQHFKGHRNRLGEDDINELYDYLRRHGHFKHNTRNDVLAKLNAILQYVNGHQTPYEWSINSPDYVQNVIHLYDEIKEVAGFEQQQQLVLITRIISVLYGCCPTFDAQLCSLLHLNPRSNDLSAQYLLNYQNLCNKGILILWILALNSCPNILPEAFRTPEHQQQIEEMMHSLHDGLEEERILREQLLEILNPNNQ